MAPLLHCLLIVLSGLLLTDGYKLPTLKLLFRDGAFGENVEGHHLGVHSESRSSTPGKWEWRTGEDAAHAFSPLLPRRKRDGGTAIHHYVTERLKTIVTQPPRNDSITKELQEVNKTTEPTLHKKIETTEPTLWTVSETTESAPRELDETTEPAPHELDETTEPVPHELDETTEPMPHELDETTEPASHKLDETTKPASHKLDETTEPAPHELDETTKPAPRELDETTEPGLIGTDFSTATTGIFFKAKGTVRERSTTAKAMATTTSIIQVKPSPETSSTGAAADLIGKCLLAIFLFALIASIFIVSTAVLAILLWRQKRAYRLQQRNQKEMVCISSLLAAEEAEEAGGQHPRVRRLRMLGENGSELELDNLTLNSFLPEH